MRVAPSPFARRRSLTHQDRRIPANPTPLRAPTGRSVPQEYPEPIVSPKPALTLVLALALGATPALADDPWGAPPVALSPIFNYYAAIAASGTTVHLSYGDEAVYYRRSLDEGETWSSPVFIGNGFNFLADPLFVDGDDIYLVYVDNIRYVSDWHSARPIGDVFMRISRDGGETWLPEQQLTSTQSAFRVSLAVAGGQLHLIWMDRRSTSTWDIYYLRGENQPDGTVIWEPERQRVAGTNSFGAEHPQLAVAGDYVHLAWMDARDDNPPCLIESEIQLPQCPVVYYTRSTDGGLTFEPDQRMVAADVYSGRPDITTDSNGTVLLPFDFGIDPTAATSHLLRSTDNGDTWTGAPEQISFPPGEAHHSFACVEDQRAHYAWSESGGESEEIVYRGSIDGGATYGPEEFVAATDKAAPLMTASDHYVHVIWSSGTVMYRRRDLEVMPVPEPNAHAAGVVALLGIAALWQRRRAGQRRNVSA